MHRMDHRVLLPICQQQNIYHFPYWDPTHLLGPKRTRSLKNVLFVLVLKQLFDYTTMEGLLYIILSKKKKTFSDMSHFSNTINFCKEKHNEHFIVETHKAKAQSLM